VLALRRQAEIEIGRYVRFYNEKRRHQGLGGKHWMKSITLTLFNEQKAA
jgi:hypothetical protein